jgi:hypothetical protein
MRLLNRQPAVSRTISKLPKVLGYLGEAMDRAARAQAEMDQEDLLGGWAPLSTESATTPVPGFRPGGERKGRWPSFPSPASHS